MSEERAKQAEAANANLGEISRKLADSAERALSLDERSRKIYEVLGSLNVLTPLLQDELDQRVKGATQQAEKRGKDGDRKLGAVGITATGGGKDIFAASKEALGQFPEMVGGLEGLQHVLDALLRVVPHMRAEFEFVVAAQHDLALGASQLAIQAGEGAIAAERLAAQERAHG